MWDAAKSQLTGASAVMDGLKKLARRAAKEDQPIHFTTPSGFPLVQSYMDLEHRRIKTTVDGKLVYLKVYEQADTISGTKQASSVAPNFVHSLDASHLALTILASRDRGVTSFALVHDSYGTHAADMPILAGTLREVFVDMYQSNDVLKQVWDYVQSVVPESLHKKLPSQPVVGDLDLNVVLDSDYFFA